MSHFVCVSRARFAFRLALTGAAAGMLAGCANSERLSDPLSNPFQTSANVTDQTAAPGVAASMPVSPVQSHPLSAPIASASPPAQPNPRMAAVSALPSRAVQGAAGWSAQGGSPIVVAQGETATILANRYGIPLDVLVRTNGFSSASQIQPGSHIVIPVYNAALAASSGAPTGKAATPVKAAAAAAPRSLASRRKLAQVPATKIPAQKTAAVTSASCSRPPPHPPNKKRCAPRKPRHRVKRKHRTIRHRSRWRRPLPLPRKLAPRFPRPPIPNSAGPRADALSRRLSQAAMMGSISPFQKAPP